MEAIKELDEHQVILANGLPYEVENNIANEDEDEEPIRKIIRTGDRVYLEKFGVILTQEDLSLILGHTVIIHRFIRIQNRFHSIQN